MWNLSLKASLTFSFTLLYAFNLPIPYRITVPNLLNKFSPFISSKQCNFRNSTGPYAIIDNLPEMWATTLRVLLYILLCSSMRKMLLWNSLNGNLQRPCNCRQQWCPKTYIRCMSVSQCTFGVFLYWRLRSSMQKLCWRALRSCYLIIGFSIGGNFVWS